MTPKLLMTAAIAGLLGTSALAAPTAPVETDAPVVTEAPTVHLSSAEIDGHLTTYSNVPENCNVTYIGGQCAGVVCEEDGMLVFYECSEFGL